MLQVPAGNYAVDSSILSRGMSSYINSLMKQNTERQEIGAYVNGTALTCIFENGELICFTENKCFMKKVLSEKNEVIIDVQKELDMIKHSLNDDVLASIFVDPEEDPIHVRPFPDTIESASEDYGNWMKNEPELMIEEIKISFISPTGQMDSTKPTVLDTIDQNIRFGRCDLTTSNFWDDSIPKNDRINLYKFLKTLNDGIEIHLIARNKPILKLATSNEKIWNSDGEEGFRLEILALPPQYQGRFPGHKLLPRDGPVHWLMISFYYLLYWVFKMIETNLGREFDGDLRGNDDKSSFLLKPSWN
jgi:hypothetical protein